MPMAGNRISWFVRPVGDSGSDLGSPPQGAAPAGTLKGRRGRSGDGAGEADADEDEHNGSYAGEDYPQSQLSRCFPKVNSYGGTPYLVAVSVDVRATLNCYRG
jgi:hypothetical protein